MEQNTQLNENNAEVKLDGEGEPINPSSKKPLNQKVIVLILVAVFLVIVGIVYFLFLNKEDNSQLFPEVMENEEVVGVEVDKQLDTDQDGLPDYMEKILGTDENNLDTDGDSYSDFEEIKNGYNPLTDEKFTEEGWGVVKEMIRSEDNEIFIKVFFDKINCEYKKGEYEVRYYDSSGRVTGLVNGEMKEEIPNFNPNEDTVTGLIPQDINMYEIFGVKEGNYRLNVIGSDGEDLIGFSATNIPIFPGETHRYVLGQDIVSGGYVGTTLSIDADNDNVFEKKINVDSEFTCEEFISQMKKLINND